MNFKAVLPCAILSAVFATGFALADDCRVCPGGNCDAAPPVVALTYPTAEPVAAPPQPVKPAPWWARWLPPPRRRPVPPPPRPVPPPRPRPAVPPPRW